MVKGIVVKNYDISVLVDDEDFEWLNQFEWKAFEIEGILRVVRIVPNGDGTWSYRLLEDIIAGLDY